MLDTPKFALIVIAMVCCIAAVGTAVADEPDARWSTSKQKLGLFVTGQGKAASIRLPRDRDNTATHYVFGGSIDVRKPRGKTDPALKTTIATYFSTFKRAMFADLWTEGAFLEDIYFSVSESGHCPGPAVSEVVNSKHFLSENVVEEQNVGGRSWRVRKHLWRLHETSVNKISFTYGTVLAETETCVSLTAGFTERIAPHLPNDPTKYVHYDASPRAQSANARMRQRLLEITRNAAASFRID
jgi:hypothetical protein